MASFLTVALVRYSLLSVSALFLLSACDNTTTSEGSQQEFVGDANIYGVFVLRRKSIDYFDSFASENGAFAIFVRSDRVLSANELFSNYRLPLDTCLVRKSADDVISAPASGIQWYEYSNIIAEMSINAGDVLSLSSSEGTWLEVPYRQQNVGDSVYYFYSNIDNPIVEPAPESLRLSIPGSEYPTYADIVVPNVESLEIQSPQDGVILQLDTSFEWNTATAENTFVRIVADKHVGTERYELDCIMEDDGEFDIPESTRLELGELFKDYSYRIYRSVYSIQQVDGSMLLIFHTEGTL